MVAYGQTQMWSRPFSSFRRSSAAGRQLRGLKVLPPHGDWVTEATGGVEGFKSAATSRSLGNRGYIFKPKHQVVTDESIFLNEPNTDASN